MARCYKCCKHNHMGFCNKYKEFIPISRNIMHFGILIHPLYYLETYYDYDSNDIEHLINIASKYLNDDVSQNIIRQYKLKENITHKQRKYLVYKLLHCYEP